MNAMPTDFDNLWEYWLKGNYEEYFKIYDRVMTAKFQNENNETRVPLRVYFRGNTYKTSKALDKNMTVLETVKLLFPNSHKDGEFLEPFKGVDVACHTVALSSEFVLKDIYKLFANPDGYLYLTVSI